MKRIAVIFLTLCLVGCSFFFEKDRHLQVRDLTKILDESPLEDIVSSDENTTIYFSVVGVVCDFEPGYSSFTLRDTYTTDVIPCSLNFSPENMENGQILLISGSFVQENGIFVLEVTGTKPW